jgi:hypothetical protein
MATDLNGKADTDLTNATDQAKILMGGMAMPSNKIINLTVGASGSTYTAPANGWFFFSRQATANGQYAQIANSNGVYNKRNEAFQYGACNVLFPVINGTTVSVSYTCNGTLYHFKFIYAKGSESEAS